MPRVRQQAADRSVRRYLASTPCYRRYRDLATEPVPPLDSAYCALGRRAERHGPVPPGQVAALARTPAEQRQWTLTRPLIDETLAAGTVLIGVPMYNYEGPAALKAWIDWVTFPGAFTEPGTGHSLLRDLTVVAITTQGGAYGPGPPRQGCDFQGPYLRAYFRRHGVADENIHLICAELTLAGLVPHLAPFPTTSGQVAHRSASPDNRPGRHPRLIRGPPEWPEPSAQMNRICPLQLASGRGCSSRQTGG